MMPTNCESALENLVESVRLGLKPGRELQAHMKSCESCSTRFASEKALSAQLAGLRAITRDMRSPAERREALMYRFERTHTQQKSNRWLWSLAAAAALVLGLLLIHGVKPGAPLNSISRAAAQMETAEVQIADTQEDGFIAVPYVPPLATGEVVNVVHTSLYPAALANLGINVDPAWSTAVSADLLMGEDGFPRAVRVSTDDSYSKKF